MAPRKPFPRLQYPDPTRLRERSRMTAAIGFPFANEPRKGSKIVIDGIFVCADTKVVASDNATSHGSKMALSLTPGSSRRFIIANAAEDAHAATMLAAEISTALCQPSSTTLESTIKQAMQAWYSAYSGGRAPSIEFIIGTSVDGVCSLFYASPPNTVLYKSHPFAIGTGARAIEPLLPTQDAPLWKLESTILRAAYCMYHAKNEEGTYVGGKTDAAVIDREGYFGFLEHEEMEQAEKASQEADKLFRVLCLGLFSRETLTNQRAFLSDFCRLFTEASAKATNIKFDSLNLWNKIQKGRPHSKKSAFQKSTGPQ